MNRNDVLQDRLDASWNLAVQKASSTAEAQPRILSYASWVESKRAIFARKQLSDLLEPRPPAEVILMSSGQGNVGLPTLCTITRNSGDHLIPRQMRPEYDGQSIDLAHYGVTLVLHGDAAEVDSYYSVHCWDSSQWTPDAFLALTVPGKGRRRHLYAYTPPQESA